MSLVNYIYLATILFCIGGAAVLTRRNAIIVFMGVELMLNAANLAFVTFARMHGNIDGQNAAGECGHDLSAEPVAQRLALPRRGKTRARQRHGWIVTQRR